MTKPKALLIRIDRLGDLILTLPADQQVSLKDYECHWFISKGLGFIPSNSIPRKNYHEWSKDFSISQFRQFVTAIKQLAPELSVSFHSPWWVHLALFIAGVPKRIGVLSKWHSFLFLNKGLRQKRSQCEFHEMEYNHLLVKEALNDTSEVQFPHLHLKAQKEYTHELPKNYVVVHPGMAGSALNWPIHHYSQLITDLCKRTKVVITGTKTDQHILKPLKILLSEQTNTLWLNEQLNGDELISILSKAKAAFAPSTGVVHIAASTGIPTFGIYSPVVVQKAQRWGPKGNKTKSFTPSVDCPAHFKCLGSTCQYFNCMELVSPKEIYNNISLYL